MISTRKHSPKNNVSWWLSILRVLTIRILLNFLHLHTWLPKLHKRSSWCKCEKNLLLFLLIKNRIQGCAFLSCLFNKKKFTRTENAGQWYCFLSTVTVSWLPDVECVLGEGQYRRHCRGQQTHTLACLKKTSCGVFFFCFSVCPWSAPCFYFRPFCKVQVVTPKTPWKVGTAFLAASETFWSVTHKFNNKIIKTTQVRTIWGHWYTTPSWMTFAPFDFTVAFGSCRWRGTVGRKPTNVVVSLSPQM